MVLGLMNVLAVVVGVGNWSVSFVHQRCNVDNVDDTNRMGGN